ncbi:unnamed protein product [Eruca vesicaria subsp. sativa]|uniref:Uncharacterized protein n=1 Tax=Eruca vesicaria subsp. sativa TaxID=29727 RepID=A0ABC8JNH3_ERUVS|nr:unnamed protein product [Eruca vesicaria subsp. sativa]
MANKLLYFVSLSMLLLFTLSRVWWETANGPQGEKNGLISFSNLDLYIFVLDSMKIISTLGLVFSNR